jgi:dTDP-4-dehydrorhamnose reductase
MRALITGGRGQLGRALSECVPPGVDAYLLGRTELDITCEGAVRDAFTDLRPDIVLNAAAYTAVDRAESEPELCHAVNARGARLLAMAAAANGTRFVHVSTDFVYDGKSSTPYAPDDAPHPLGVYGESKLLGERAVLEVLAERAAVVRTAWIYSAWGRNFVCTMLQLMAERGAVRVVADQVGSPTSSRSLARTLWQLARRTDVHGIQHWTDAGLASWYDFAVAIAEEAAALNLVPSSVSVTPISTSEHPTAARRPAYSVLDSRATNARLEVTPVHWRKNLRETLREIASA